MYEYKAKVVRVVDGDTLDLMVDLGFTVYVRIRARLEGIDTPETYGVKKGSAEWVAGMESKKAVLAWLVKHGRSVTIKTTKGTGKYGRWLATICTHDMLVSLNQYLLDEGFAAPYDGGKR